MVLCSAQQVVKLFVLNKNNDGWSSENHLYTNSVIQFQIKNLVMIQIRYDKKA